MHRRFRLPIVWLLLAAAILLRAGMPAGWMPTSDQAGGLAGVRIALCTGTGTQFLIMDSQGSLHKDAPAPQAPRDPCPYALTSAHAADIPREGELRQPPALLPALQTPAMAVAAVTVRRSIRPPARGPPTFA